MNSLNMKMLSGFNPGTTATRSWPGRIGDFEAATGRQWLNCGNRARTLRITACASISGGGGSGGMESQRESESSFLSRSQTYALLKQKMEVAAKSEGVRVQVRSVYIEGRSQPSKGQYFFAYRIRITNNSDRPVQLLRRHWIITDANGKTENVWGIGVIGEQPVILPNNGFEYSSACPLSTPSGRMVTLISAFNCRVGDSSMSDDQVLKEHLSLVDTVLEL